MTFVRFQDGIKIVMCPACWGEGQIEYRDATQYAVWEKCEDCDGAGEIEEEDTSE